jgi:phosphomannomutase
MKSYSKVVTIDGVRLELSDSWALIRASNTSPKIRLTVEAKSRDRLEEVKSEMIALIKKAAKSDKE